MPRVLLIEPNGDALVTLQQALGQAGFSDVVVAPSGSFALTTLERDRPDLIVTRASLPDIDGYELCSIVRSDPAMTGVLFLLLAGPGSDVPERALETGPDQTLVGEFTVAAVVSEVTRLLRSKAAPASPSQPVVAPSQPVVAPSRPVVAPSQPVVAPSRPIAAPSRPAVAPSKPVAPPSQPAALPSQPAVVPSKPVAPPSQPAVPPSRPAVVATQPEAANPLRGPLGVKDLPAVTQAITAGGKTGHLLFALPSGLGVIIFDRGRVVHAEIRGLTGEAAFAALLVAAHREVPCNITFSPLESVADLPRTIQRDLKQLLLSAAAKIDDGRTGKAVAPVK